jgi:hypothetical protein
MSPACSPEPWAKPERAKPERAKPEWVKLEWTKPDRLGRRLTVVAGDGRIVSSCNVAPIEVQYAGEAHPAQRRPRHESANVLGWQSFVRERERRLASESEPLKSSRVAAVGLEYLDSACTGDDLPHLLASVRVRGGASAWPACTPPRMPAEGAFRGRRNNRYNKRGGRTALPVRQRRSTHLLLMKSRKNSSQVIQKMRYFVAGRGRPRAPLPGPNAGPRLRRPRMPRHCRRLDPQTVRKPHDVTAKHPRNLRSDPLQVACLREHGPPATALLPPAGRRSRG